MAHIHTNHWCVCTIHLTAVLKFAYTNNNQQANKRENEKNKQQNTRVHMIVTSFLSVVPNGAILVSHI